MIRRLTTICAMLALLLTLGCGQKGPLYLPQDSTKPQHDTEAEKQE